MSRRRAPENNNNNDAMQQLMAAQAQLMTMMTQFIAASNNNNNNNNNPPPPPPPQVDRLTRFLRLRPNKFSTSTKPMVADDWLRSVQKDLVTTECDDAEKVRFTAHLLEGPAAQWWETYQITHPLDTLTWEEFKEGFRNAHVSTGIMNLKQEEFRNLRQGNRSLKEYMDDFHALSRYAPEDIDTDAKRKAKFLKGLCDELKIPLTIAYAPNYQILLDQAITLEDSMKKAENRKRKMNKHSSEPSYKKHFVHDGNHGHKLGNHHSGGSNHKHHEHNGGFKGNGHDAPNHNHRPNGEPKKNLNHITCYNCKKQGHYSTDCPEKKGAEAAVKPNPFDKGYVNHISVAEVNCTF